MENNNEQSSMEIVEKDQEIAFVDSFNDAVLSYQYRQVGFTINLMQRSVLLFNNVLNSTFIYTYSNIREINYSLPDCRSDDAEICIMTDDVLNPVWTFRVPSDAHYICKQWVEAFNNHIFFSP
ncbi:hypothetical protein AB244_14760 [Salmonella enterica]|nr:hypothetical protein [Salmonella enterica]EDP9452270.1 hypothetical protein [Salmonella enterica subsp. enterica serovar Inverness]EAY6894808.1 hypothetical protein [Salmonella enterica]EAY7308793.1 hypothetical protein [Salmonella enterica]EBP7070724.1 hypothetical protein [Salmonella enterica]